MGPSGPPRREGEWRNAWGRTLGPCEGGLWRLPSPEKNWVGAMLRAGGLRGTRGVRRSVCPLARTRVLAGTHACAQWHARVARGHARVGPLARTRGPAGVAPMERTRGPAGTHAWARWDARVGTLGRTREPAGTHAWARWHARVAPLALARTRGARLRTRWIKQKWYHMPFVPRMCSVSSEVARA